MSQRYQLWGRISDFNRLATFFEIVINFKNELLVTKSSHIKSFKPGLPTTKSFWWQNNFCHHFERFEFCYQQAKNKWESTGVKLGWNWDEIRAKVHFRSFTVPWSDQNDGNPESETGPVNLFCAFFTQREIFLWNNNYVHRVITLIILRISRKLRFARLIET